MMEVGKDGLISACFFHSPFFFWLVELSAFKSSLFLKRRERERNLPRSN